MASTNTQQLDDIAIQALSDAGAICGDCGSEPGDRVCPDCERCRGWYVAALRAAGWAPGNEELTVEVNRLRAELAQERENYQAYRIGAEGAKAIAAKRIADLDRMVGETQQPETQTDGWHLTPQTLDLFVRALVNEVDYDIHKGYECGEEDGLDHYPELVAEAAEMLDAITAEQPAAAQQPKEADPVIEPHCDGFPGTCPNRVNVPPAPPHHDGGTRCGCYDEPAAAQPKEARP